MYRIMVKRHTDNGLLQVVKAGHFKSFAKVSALGYPDLPPCLQLHKAIYSCTVTYLVQNVVCARCDNVNACSPNHIRRLPTLSETLDFFTQPLKKRETAL